jgi:hypothetical protein
LRCGVVLAIPTVSLLGVAVVDEQLASNGRATMIRVIKKLTIQICNFLVFNVLPPYNNPF